MMRVEPKAIRTWRAGGQPSLGPNPLSAVSGRLRWHGDASPVRWGARIVLVAGLGAVAWASLVPIEDVPMSTAVSDKVQHVAAYALLGVAAALAQRTPRVMLTIALLVGFGFLIETLQGMTDYRSFDLVDLLADTLGAAVGVLVVVFGRTRHRVST